ncbi:MAG: GNAT family N-acetyltransferase [Ktedonobacterales bacterium]
MEIRDLTEADVAAYWPLRLRALREEPQAFGASYEESKDRPLEKVVERVRTATEGDNFLLGAYEDGRLVGTVMFQRETGWKERHIGNIYGMYIAPEVRGQGCGRALMLKALGRARTLPGLEQIYLAVGKTNVPARTLYLDLGFEVYALFRHGLKVGETYIDEEAMVLWLDPAMNGAAS